MTEQPEHIDWDEVERRAREREPLVTLTFIAVVAGWAGLSEQLFSFSGTAKWIVAAVYAGTFLLLLVAQRVHPRFRARNAEGYRLQYALRRHVDPGPELRGKVDRQAGHMARIVWFRWWLLLLLPVGPLIAAPWDRPLVTVPSALVLVAGVAAGALSMRRLYADARRWVSDPPGPPRELPPPRRWERWFSGWPFVWALVAIVLVTVAVVLGLSLGD